MQKLDNIEDGTNTINDKNILDAPTKMRNAIDNLKKIKKDQINRTYLIACLMYAIIFVPLAIVTITLGAISPGDCDIKDMSGLTIANYLLIGGSVSLVVDGFMLLYFLLMWKNIISESNKIVAVCTTILLILYGLFSFSWFIVGAVVLFRSNIECINKNSSHVIYALIIWCISAFNMFYNCCCNIKKKSDK